jgi:hypothetical protein
VSIEIENSKGAKHALGDIFNASAMGKIGIVVPLGEDRRLQFFGLIKYLQKLKGYGKTHEDFPNIMIIEGNKLLELLRSYNAVRRGDRRLSANL